MTSLDPVSPAFRPEPPRHARTQRRTSSPDEPAVQYLHPGQLFASGGQCTISTILGSCVSVCLFDRHRGIGGANHFLLPHDVRGVAQPARYGPPAIRELLARLQRLGASPSTLEAKIFGGAAMIVEPSGSARRLGAMNVAVAREILHDAAIPIRAEDVGGARGRKLLFQVHDGSAWTRVI